MMKSILSLMTLAFCTPVSVKAQEVVKKSVNEIDVSYYNTHIGQNIAAEYNRNFGKHTLVLGIKCHLNHHVGFSDNLNNNYVYRKHFYARKFPDFIGATIGYEYHLRDINPYVSPYLLYNLQYAQMPTKHFYARAESGNYTYRINQVYDGPFIALENTIGAGLSVKLNNYLSLNQSIGMEIPFIFDSEPEYSRPAWTLDGLYPQWRVGLSIQL